MLIVSEAGMTTNSFTYLSLKSQGAKAIVQSALIIYVFTKLRLVPQKCMHQLAPVYAKCNEARD